MTSPSFAKGKKKRDRRRADDPTQLTDSRIQEINLALMRQEELNSLNYEEATADLVTLKEDLHDLNKSIDPKWDKYRDWQQNAEWVQNTVDMSLSGEIYNEGWFGPNITRQIVPDLINGWLVVDTITIGPSLLMTGATLVGNILLNQVFPYVQGGPIKEKTFVNVRKVNTYEEAVMAETFNIEKLPLRHQDFDFLAEEEQISTISTGGMFIRAGGGIANLIGLELPAHINIGPKSKLTFKGSLKLTVAKDKDNHALISVERASEQSNGIGFGFGIFFEDIVDIPVTIGVNSSNGYFPFLFNVKDTYRQTKSIVYDIDLNTTEGQLAYQAFLKRDFAFIEDMAVQHPSAVVMDMQKEGDIHSHEVNAMVNLIVWRSGFRNIFVEGKFNTTDRAGNRFEYFELESEDIRDKKWFSNIEKTSLKFMALVPSDRHENGELIEHKGGFVLDTHFFYNDTKTEGEEINDISDYLMDFGTQMRLPVQVNKERNYEHVQIDAKVRIQSEDMAEFLRAHEQHIWHSIAYAQGIHDHYQYSTEFMRNRFVEQGNYGDRSDRRKLVRRGQKVIDYVNSINSQPTLKDKAHKMIDYLRKDESGQLLHKTILEFIGNQKVMVRGFVRGKYL